MNQTEMNQTERTESVDSQTMQVDADDTLYACLKRGITRKKFFHYIEQLIKIHQNCQQRNIRIEMNLKEIHVSEETLIYKASLGNQYFNDRQMAEWLRSLAFEASFTGSDFLEAIHEYLSILDRNHENAFQPLLDQMPALKEGRKVTMCDNQNEISHKQPAYIPPSQIPVAPKKGLFQRRKKEKVIKNSKETAAPHTVPANALSSNASFMPVPPNAAPIRTIPDPGMLPQNMDETSVLDTSAWRPAATASHALLVDLKSGNQVVLDKPCFSLGKDSKYADYAFQNNAISRTHAIINRRDNRYFLTDNGSTNGTFVNGNQIFQGKPVEIKNADLIKLADLELKMVIQ